MTPKLKFAALILAWGGFWVSSGAHGAEDLIPNDMAFVAHSPSVMGLDREEKSKSFQALTAYERRMKTPWSADAFHDEGPAHMVFLDSFLIDKFEVSNGQFKNFMTATGHPAPAYWDDPRLNKPNQPVVGVNWHDAKAFCEWNGKRLPTEAEWEKAARGPDATLYPWGNKPDPSKANYGKRLDTTEPVDSHPEGVSYYGVHNMAGNVFEWVSDWYDPQYYGRLETMVNPAGPAKPIWLGGTGTYVDRLTVGEKRVIRGGSWIAPEATVRSTHRFWNHPQNNSYGVGLGFRCAKSAPPELDQRINQAYTSALREMGRERFPQALKAIESGLTIDPKNVQLLEVQSLIEKTKKSS